MNLLTDPLLRVETGAGMEGMSLPALLESLGGDRVLAYPGIQQHQEDAFHVFLCHLAGAALARAEVDSPSQPAEFWHRQLRQLASQDDAAWSLVEEKLDRPAFLQPPLPKTDWTKLKPKAETADDLDLLPTAKNHDLKMARADRSEADQWVYALINLQTMSGYFGKGNQGIARMNGGFGSRSIVELCHSVSPGARWRDAVVRLLAYRKDVLAGPWGYRPDGLVLLWLQSWDGKNSLRMSRLDPFFIEVCRRIRLQRGRSANHIQALAAPASAPRVAAKDLKGNVGDAWLPIDLSKDAALTVGPTGLTAELLRRVIFEDALKLTPMHKPAPDKRGPVSLCFSVLVRGQGTTEGFHKALVRIPAGARKRLFQHRRDQLDQLAALSKTAIEYAAIMQNKVLKPATFSFLQGAPEAVKFDRDATSALWRPVADQFQQRWSGDYFPWLWQAAEAADPGQSRYDWAVLLRDHALTVFRDATRSMPGHSGRRYRILSRAERRFFGALYSPKHFPFLKEERHAPRTA